MLGRIADALATLLKPTWDAKIQRALDDLKAERERDRVEVRTLISEMDDVLEKFSRVVARQAKRHARDMKKQMGEGEEGDGAEIGAADLRAENVHTDIKSRKSELRRRAFGHLNPRNNVASQ